MAITTCPGCGETVTVDRHPWVLHDDGTGRTRILDNDANGEANMAAERHRCP